MESWETRPCVAMERMAHGIPVIASNIGGLPELVRDGKTGQLFPPGDAEALAEWIGRLWNDAGPCAQLAARARKFVRDRGGAEAYFRRLMGMYGRPPGKAGPLPSSEPHCADSTAPD